MKFLQKIKNKFKKGKNETVIAETDNEPVNNQPNISEPDFEELPAEVPVFEELKAEEVILDELFEESPKISETIGEVEIEKIGISEEAEEISEEKGKAKKNKKEKKPKKLSKKEKEEVEGLPKTQPKKEKKKPIFIIGAVFLSVLIVGASVFLYLFWDEIFEDRGIKVGYSICNIEDTFQMHILDAAKEEAKAKGIDLDIQNADENKDLQGEQITKMIKDGAKGLIIVPVDTSAMGTAIEEASTAGISIVFVNRNPFEDGKIPKDTCYIGAKEEMGGELQASYLKELLPEGGGVAILAGRPTNHSTVKRIEGAESVLAESPQHKILAKESGIWLKENGALITENWLKAYKPHELKAILSNNDEMALGAIEVLEREGRNDIIVLGIDAIAEAREAVANGRMAATVMQDAAGQGKGAVKMMAKILNGEKVKKNNLIDFKLITPSNVDEY